MKAVNAQRLLVALVGLMACTAASAADNPAVAFPMSRLLQVVITLVFIIGLIYLLAAVFRRSDFMPGANKRLINVLGSAVLGNNEKLHLIQVGDEQLLISQAQGEIRKLHKLARNVEVPEFQPEPGASGFPALFNNLLDKKAQSKDVQ